MWRGLAWFHGLCLLGCFYRFEIADEYALADGVVDGFVNLRRIFRIDNGSFIEDTTFGVIFAKENISAYSGDNKLISKF